MAEEISNLNLVQKLAKIRIIADAVKKNKKGYNYTYADINEILAKVTAGMNKYGVSLSMSIVHGTENVQQNVVVNTKFDKQGRSYEQTVTEMLVMAEVIFKWLNEDNTEDFIEIPWFITGMQSDPSQAFGSGLTYCKRYFLMNYFNIATVDDDVDAYRKKQKEAEATEDVVIAGEIISKVDSLVKDYLAKCPDERDEITKFMAKYIRGSNYKKIKKPEIAAKLLEDFTKKYVSNETVEKKGKENGTS